MIIIAVLAIGGGIYLYQKNKQATQSNVSIQTVTDLKSIGAIVAHPDESVPTTIVLADKSKIDSNGCYVSPDNGVKTTIKNITINGMNYCVNSASLPAGGFTGLTYEDLYYTTPHNEGYVVIDFSIEHADSCTATAQSGCYDEKAADTFFEKLVATLDFSGKIYPQETASTTSTTTDAQLINQSIDELNIENQVLMNLKGDNIKECQQIASDDYLEPIKDNCFSNLAYKNRDPSICANVTENSPQTKYYKSNCYDSVYNENAFYSKDPSLCAKIVDPVARSGCNGQFKTKQQTSAPISCDAVPIKINSPKGGEVFRVGGTYDFLADITDTNNVCNMKGPFYNYLLTLYPPGDPRSGQVKSFREIYESPDSIDWPITIDPKWIEIPGNNFKLAICAGACDPSQIPQPKNMVESEGYFSITQ